MVQPEMPRTYGTAKKLEIWKVKGKEQYFQKISDTKWKETDKRKLFATFDFVEQINDKVIIFAEDRDFYLTIDSTLRKLSIPKFYVIEKIKKF